LRFKE